jgi:UDP-glucose 4-epimerase
LEAARAEGVKRFLYAASSTCYSIDAPIPTHELSPIALLSPYALTKYLGEQYVLHWGNVYKLPVVSLRLFDVYGEPDKITGNAGPFLTFFLKQKKLGIPYSIVGDGSQSRDFVHVSDVVSALITAAKSDIYNEIFNVGIGEPHSINEVVSLLGGKEIHDMKRREERRITCADIGKITKRLQWRPSVSFEEGMKQVSGVNHV